MSPVLGLNVVAVEGKMGKEREKREERNRGMKLPSYWTRCWSSAMELSQINPGIKPLRLARRQEEEPWF